MVVVVTAVVVSGRFWSGVRLKFACGVWAQTDAHHTCQAAVCLQPPFVVVVVVVVVVVASE